MLTLLVWTGLHNHLDLGSFIYVHLCASGNSMFLVVTPSIGHVCQGKLYEPWLCVGCMMWEVLEVPYYEVVLHRLDMHTCHKGPRVIAIHCKEAAINVGCCVPLIFIASGGGKFKQRLWSSCVLNPSSLCLH